TLLRMTPLLNRSAMSTPYAVDVADLTVAYRDQPVLWDVDLQVPEGVLMAVVGPNGAGKTTLIKAVLGLGPKAAGRVLVHGAPSPCPPGSAWCSRRCTARCRRASTWPWSSRTAKGWQRSARRSSATCRWPPAASSATAPRAGRS